VPISLPYTTPRKYGRHALHASPWRLPPAYSDERVANRNVGDFGWGVAHGAVSRRPPISLYTMVPRTGCYTYDVGVCDLSIVQGPFSVARAKP
jgi:hypothetical protein